MKRLWAMRIYFSILSEKGASPPGAGIFSGGREGRSAADSHKSFFPRDRKGASPPGASENGAHRREEAASEAPSSFVKGGSTPDLHTSGPPGSDGRRRQDERGSDASFR